MKKTIIVLMVILMLMSTVASTFANDQDIRDGEIDFKYKVTPYDKEWADLDDKSEMIAACHIPKKALDKMSTHKLLDLVLDYPLIVNIFLYNTYEEGLKHLANESDAYREFISRDDSNAVLLKRLNTKDRLREKSLDESVLILLASKNIVKDLSNEDEIYRLNIEGTVPTPNGSQVPVVVKGELLDSTQINNLHNLVSSTYPQATILSKATTNYNCHSYAWHSQSTSNRFWMDNPSLYMSDGSYMNVSSPSLASHIHYPYGGHSAVIYDASSSTLIHATVTSKWGEGPLVRHKANYGPYNSYNLTAWVLD